MKKRYICPKTELILITAQAHLLGASQVTNGGKPGDEYNSEDVSYSRRRGYDVWEEEEEEDN